MVQQIINAIIPVLVTALIGVLTVVIKGVGDAAIAYIGRKKDAVITKIGADTYNHNLTVARSIWGAVDEEVRTNPTLQKLANDVTARIEAKQKLFAEKIQKAIPGITDDEIEQLRQAVAGEVNKGKAAIVGQTQDEQGNGVKVTAPADSAPQVAAQPESGTIAPNTTGAA